MRHIFVAVCLTLFAGLFHIASAQDGVAFEQGIKPYGSFHGGDIDSISMSNVQPSLHIPLISYPQRGGKLKVDFGVTMTIPTAKPSVQCETVKPFTCFSAFFSWNWNYQWQGTPIAGTFGDGPQVVSTFTPSAGCYNFINGAPNCATAPYRVLDSDGATHQAGRLASGKYLSLDGTGFLYDPATGIMTDRNGTRTTLHMSTNGQRVQYLSSIEDVNGNMIATDASATTGLFTKYIDTLGRSIPNATTSTTDFSGCTGPYPIASAVLWAPPGPSGGTSTFKICYGAIPTGQYFPPTCDGPPCTNGIAHGGNEIQSIVLPNGTAWTFEYDINNMGFVNKIIFPTGGSISYTWSVSPLDAGPSVHLWSPSAFCITSRTVDANDGTGPHTWNYTQKLFSGSHQTIVTDPVGNDTVHTMTPVGPSIGSFYETQLDKYQGSYTAGTLLETTITDYAANKNPYDTDGQGTAQTAINVVPIHITTKYFTGGNTQTKRIEKDYDAGIGVLIGTPTGTNAIYGNVIAEREYDFGTTSWGGLIRQTKTLYQAFNGPNAALYLANNLTSHPYSVQTLNGSGSQVAYTQYGYDESSLGSSGVGSSEQHDTAPPAGTNRGNQTSILHWLNSGTMTCQNGHSGGTGSNVTSKLTYFDTGTLQTSADPCGNTTTFAYSSTFWGTFPTTITNALTQATTNNYDFNTGLLLSTTDPNNLATSYSYDSMWRLSTVTHPDRGVDTITHQESTYPFSSTLTKTMSATQSVVTKNIFDGLGRTTQSQLVSDPQGIVYTDTTYDVLGRVSTVSNPYRTGGDVTTSSGITTYGYDALNRKTTETYADNSVLTTAYCGADTKVTDPAGRWRRSRVDGLGRLVEVDEPNAIGATVAATGCPGTSEPIWITSYTNDALGNLTQIVQNGSHARTFTYDSFSRMLTSNNPEVGTLTYTYNPDGIVLTKKDARSITTSYTYDALHREKTVTYSNGDPAGISTNYDEATCLTGVPQCNNIGQRTSMTDAAGSEIWAYDVPDRIHKEQRTTSGISNSTTYTLDYVGNVASIVYPTGRIVYYVYDSANRPSVSYDSSRAIVYALGTCSTNQTVWKGVCYTPQGTPYSMILNGTGAFTGANVTNTYNNRLQPNEFKASSTGGNAIDITYNFIDSVSGKNSGHVNSITNNLDSTRSQTFAYDQLNRIISAQTTSTHATSPAHCWGETYSLDAWGNLQSIAQTTNTNYTGCTQENGFSVTADGNNHLLGLNSDASGNTLSDGANTYTWDGESQLKSAGGVNYLYDGDGRRVAKVGSKLYWYGSGGEILSETTASGALIQEFIYFGGRRIAKQIYGGGGWYFVQDMLGSSRIVAQDGTVLYDADFYPYGGERAYYNPYSQNYLFEGKERDAETGNDDFGARYYSNRFGRWLSADWSNVPAPVPYAHLTNPQTLNLYSMVADDPESFADLDGHATHCYGEKLRLAECHSDNPESAKENTNAASQSANQKAESQKPQYDSKKNGPEDPTNPGHPLSQNSVVKKGMDEAFMKTTNGTARSGLAEAGGTIELKDGKISIANKVDSVNSDKKPNALGISPDGNTIAIFHVHGNGAQAIPSPGDRNPNVQLPDFVRSQRSLYVTVPHSATGNAPLNDYIQLQ